MKKIRIYILAIIMALLSTVITACSCSGEAPITHVNAKDINISFVSGTGSTTSEIDEYSGDLMINCRVGESFVIKYDITPAESTTTQVNWSFSTKGLVKEHNGDNYRKKSVSEQIRFDAINRSQDSYNTIITFAVDELGMEVKAIVNVFPKEEDVAIFTAPENVRFDTETNTLEWDRVDTYSKGGVVEPAEMSGGVAVGLSGYEVITLNPSTGAVVSTQDVFRNVTKLEGFEAGTEYAVQVRAKGDILTTADSAPSETYRFYKIMETQNVANDNGVISYTTTPYAHRINVAYNRDRTKANDDFVDPVVDSDNFTEGTHVEFNYKNKFDTTLNQYEVTCVAYPDEYNEKDGYAMLTSTRSGQLIRVFPSDVTESLIIQKIATPIISLYESERVKAVVGDKEFANVLADTAIKFVTTGLGEESTYGSQFGHKYSYTIYKTDDEEVVSGTINAGTSEPDNSNSNTISRAILSISSRLDCGQSYTIKVTGTGNAGNTIASAEAEFEFFVLNNAADNISLDGDKLQVIAGGQSAGTELFFVPTDTTKATKYLRMQPTSQEGDSSEEEGEGESTTSSSGAKRFLYDLSTLDVPAGEYKLYVKNIGFDGIYKTASISKNNTLNPVKIGTFETITILPKVTDSINEKAHKIDKDGRIVFSPISVAINGDTVNFMNYELIIANKGNGEEYSEHKIKAMYVESLDQASTVEGGSEDVVAYTKDSSGAYYIDIYRAIEILFAGQEFNIEDFLNGKNSYYYRLRTLGDPYEGYDTGDTFISSWYTSQTNGGFERLDTVGSLSLNNYKISMSNPSDRATGYELKLQIVELETGNVEEYVSTVFNTQEINLRTLPYVGGGSNNIASRLTNRPGFKNQIVVYPIGEDGILNGAESSASFDTTDQVSGIGLESDGTLSWTGIEPGTGSGNTYTIRLYIVTRDGETLSFSKADEITGQGSPYTYNVTDALAKQSGNVIAITVTENNANKFDGLESDPIFATTLATPEVVKSESVIGKYEWTAINNASGYKVIVNQVGDDNNTYSDDLEDVSFALPNEWKNGDTDLDWTTGQYTIKIIAVNTSDSNTGVNDSCPIVINSAAFVETFYVVDATLDIKVTNTTDNARVIDHLMWNDILSVITVGESGISSDSDSTGEETKESIKDYILYTVTRGATTDGAQKETLFDASNFVAGDNEITITPSISWQYTGIVLAKWNNGTRLTDIATHKTINKLAVANNLRISEGNLLFDIVAASSKDYIVLLYEDDTLLPRNTYSYTFPTEEESGEAGGEGESTVSTLKTITGKVMIDGLDSGVHNLSIRVFKADFLTSDNSDKKSGTKLAVVSDLNKVRVYDDSTGNTWTDWLSWSPVEAGELYAGRYLITYGDAPITLEVTKSGGTYTPLVTVGETSEPDPSIFKFVDGKFYYKWDEEFFIGDKTGDIPFTIRALVSKEDAQSYNGDVSEVVFISKLNSESTITATNGLLTISDYVSTNQEMPVSYILTITMLEAKTESTTGEDGEPVITTTYEDKVDATGEVVQIVDSKPYTGTIEPIDLNNLTYVNNRDTIDNTEDDITIKFSADGAYKIVLQYIGNGAKTGDGLEYVANIIDSAEIENKNLPKLAVTSVYTQDGEVVWNANSAEGVTYTVEITNTVDGKSYQFDNIDINTLKGVTLTYTNDDEVPAPPSDNTTGGDTTGGDSSGDNSSTDEGVTTSSTIKETTAMVFSFEPGVKYGVKVKVNSPESLSSDWSNTAIIMKLKAPTITRVVASSEVLAYTKSETVTDEGGTETTTETTVYAPIGSPSIEWKETNNLAGLRYAIKYAGVAGASKVSSEGESASADLVHDIPESAAYKYVLFRDFEAKTYPVSMMVYGNTTSADPTAIGYLNSDFGTEYNVVYVKDADTLSVDHGNLKWTAVNGAYSYTVVATQDGKNIFETNVVSNSIDLNNTILATLSNKIGVFNVKVTANTDPADTIVSSVEVVDNNINVYRPKTLDAFNIRDGKLSWRISLTDINDYISIVDGVTATVADDESGEEAPATPIATALENIEGLEEDTTQEKVVEYVLGYIDGTIDADDTLNELISHLVSVNIEINGSAQIFKPTSAKLVADNYIEYYYDVVNEVKIEENPTEEEPDSSVSSSVKADSATNYLPGRYNVRIHSVGNKNDDSAILNGAYTTIITAYKPNTPRTWMSKGADISEGNVQWELATVAGTTINDFKRYYDYRITAVPVDNAGALTAYTNIVVDSNDSKISEEYKYYRYLKNTGSNDGLFKTSGDTNDTDVITMNTHYKLVIRANGTQDGEYADANGLKKFLNSNSCVVGELANILSPTLNSKIENGELNWSSANGATKTKLYIYGPFDDLNGTKDKTNTDWITGIKTYTEDFSLHGLDLQSEIANIDLHYKDSTKVGYYNKLHIEELGTMDDSQALLTSFNMTDNGIYAPGGYVIKSQYLGNGKGVIDGDISGGCKDAENNLCDYIPAIKLGYVKATDSTSMKNGYWVGTSTDGVYEWQAGSDSWQLKNFGSSINQVIGTFVWNPVIGANAYKIQMFSVDRNAADNVSGQEFGQTYYTTETRFDMPDGLAANNPSYRYFIRVSAIRLDNVDNRDTLSNNYFSSDYNESSRHLRLPVPSNLTIYGSGEITWSGSGAENSTSGDTNPDVGSYRTRFNFGSDADAYEIVASSGTTSSEVPEVEPQMNLGVGKQNGTLAIEVKSVVKADGSSCEIDEETDAEIPYLNSGYCNPLEVTRLADPDVRLVDGIFYWDTGSDPITDTTFTINGNNYTDLPTRSTTYKMFTDITEHDDDYTASEDETEFAVRYYDYSVRFQGSGGDTGTTMTSDSNFYVASNVRYLSATKLAAPVVHNVYVDVGGESNNMVKWLLDEDACGYKVRVFSDQVFANGQTYYEAVADIATILDPSNNTLFGYSTEDEHVYFALDDIIEELNLTQTGGNIFIYVQAVGSGAGATTIVGYNEDGTPIYDIDNTLAERPEFTGTTQTNTMFLSSSYSTPTTIGVPPTAKRLSFNQNNGELTWIVGEVVDEEVIPSKGSFNIKVRNTYTVNNITEAELNSYWKASATELYNIGNNTPVSGHTRTITPYDNIIGRIVRITNYNTTSELYTIEVEDSVLITAKDNENKTPTSYKVTSVGNNYKFYVTVMSYVSTAETTQNTFASAEVELLGTYAFTAYTSGDGSQYNPYKINTMNELQSIMLFADREYLLVNDISMQDAEGKIIPWSPIKGEFRGVIDGGNNTISLVTFNSVVSTMEDLGQQAIMTMLESNAGTIRNLNISLEVNNGVSYTAIPTNNEIVVAPITIKNSGIISNVHVTGDITVKPTGKLVSNAVAVGIASINTGTITGTTYSGNIVCETYNASMAIAGGIASNNSGTIEKSAYLSGSIKSNNVAGIVARSSGIIDRCYVTESVTIIVTDRSLAEDNDNPTYYYSGAEAGGIAGSVTAQAFSTGSKVAVSNSYSLAKIEVNVFANTSINSPYTIGGLIGSIGDNADITIENNYVKSHIVKGEITGARQIIVYYLCQDNDLVTFKNNYYYINSTTNDVSNIVSGEGTKVDSIQDLNTALSQLRDQGVNIYIVDNNNTSYPTLNI
ncbi:MAG: hypothetical protein E7356_04575 [Clostridiales bacterium]|nr:hypothetical protein [Clostridiales bacterium]